MSLMRRRPASLLLLVALTGCVSACSAPDTAAGTLTEGRSRVLALVNGAAATLPESAVFVPAQETGNVPCRRKFLGYTTGSTGAHRAEVPIVVNFEPNAVVDVNVVLDTIEQEWRDAGYAIDTSNRADQRFPKVRAVTPDGDEVVATAITGPPPQLRLYSVSECLRGA